MFTKRFILLILSCAISGCSFYDVATGTADVLLNTALEVKNPDRDEDDRVHIWNPETSECIKDENVRQDIGGKLDAIEWQALKDGKEYVVLPTGEKYPIEKWKYRGDPLLGPTGACLAGTAE